MVEEDHSVVIASADLMRVFGQRLGALCQGGENIFLAGCLGAGKTCLVQGLAQSLGITPDEVTSPSFVLHAQYRGRLILNHLDFYRLLDRPRDIEALGIDELISDPSAVCAVEWPEALPALRQSPALAITFEIIAPDKRQLTLTANDARHGALLHLLI